MKPIVKNNNNNNNNNGDGFDVPFAAKIQSTDKDKLFVIDDDGEEILITKDQVSLTVFFLYFKI